MKTLNEIDKLKFRISIGELKLWNDNYKDITRESTDALKRQLLEEGQLNPILVDARKEKQGTIIGGNSTYIAIKELVAEEKWSHGDMIWVEPIEPKSDAHAIKIAFLANSQYGKPNKERMYGLSELLVESEYSLMDIPVAREGIDYTLLDLRDELGPSENDPLENMEDIGERKKRAVECPSCNHTFEL